MVLKLAPVLVVPAEQNSGVGLVVSTNPRLFLAFAGVTSAVFSCATL